MPTAANSEASGDSDAAGANDRNSDNGYQVPPRCIEELVVGVGSPAVLLAPTRRWALLSDRPAFPSIAEVALPQVKLAGLRWHASTRLPSDLSWRACAGVRFRPVVDGENRPFPGGAGGCFDVPAWPAWRAAGLPPGSEFQYASWRCDGAAVAAVVRTPAAEAGREPLQVWVLHLNEAVAVARARRVAAEQGVGTAVAVADRGSDGADHELLQCCKAVPIVTTRHLYGIRNWPLQWLRATGHLLVRLVPTDGDYPERPPEAPSLPAGPVVLACEGEQAAPARTYQDMLRSPHDETVFAHYMTHCLYVFDTAAGAAAAPSGGGGGTDGTAAAVRGRLLGDAGGDMYTYLSLSPDASYLVVQATRRPFSYHIPASRFGSSKQVWCLGDALGYHHHHNGGAHSDAGGLSAIHVTSKTEICTVPAQETRPVSWDARPEGPRQMGWHWLEPATLLWVEAQDGGDPRNKPPPATTAATDGTTAAANPAARGCRDALVAARAPDFRDRRRLFESDLRVASVAWTDAGACLVREVWRKTRRRRMWVRQERPPAVTAGENHSGHTNGGASVGGGVVGGRGERWRRVPVFDRQYEDRYMSPGAPGSVVCAADGMSRVRTAPDGRVVLFGEGASPRGNRPFLDLLDVRPGGAFARERVWRCPAGPLLGDGEEEEAQAEEDGPGRGGGGAGGRGDRRTSNNGGGGGGGGGGSAAAAVVVPEDPSQEVGGLPVAASARQAVFEKPVEVFGNGLLLVRRESKHEPPNYHIVAVPAIAAAAATAAATTTAPRPQPLLQPPFSAHTAGGVALPVAVTSFPHPQPMLAGVRKRHIRYTRRDGVALDAQLFLPPGYDPARDGPRPCLAWAYPAEFKSRKAAGQVRGSPYHFVRAGWSRPLPWLLRGWVVLERFACPVVAEGKGNEPNDTFVEQIVASAAAAVDAVVRLGVADRDRMAVGGHSYGAFMTANLLAHSDLFRAGIARSGAFNRTLTPFGFQGEHRSFWEAADTYMKLSPFVHADKLAKKKAPLLIIHGAADANSGTHLMQSERLFNAVKGLGGVARFVKLPCEGHSYRARESILHALFEQDEWLRRFVEEGGGGREGGAATTTEAAPSAHEDQGQRQQQCTRRRAVALVSAAVAAGLGAWAQTRRARL